MKIFCTAILLLVCSFISANAFAVEIVRDGQIVAAKGEGWCHVLDLSQLDEVLPEGSYGLVTVLSNIANYEPVTDHRHAAVCGQVDDGGSGGGATYLSNLASTLAVGQTAQFVSQGFSGELIRPDGAAQTILAFSSRMTYYAPTGKIHYMGGPHGSVTRHIIYDEETNIWHKQGPDTPQTFLGPNSGGHGYEHHTVDSQGNLWWREVGVGTYSDGLQKWDAGIGAWDTIFYGGVDFRKSVNAIAYAPNLFGEGNGGIFVVDRGAGIHGLDINTKEWSTFASYFGSVGLHGFAIYLPGKDSIIFGGGDNVLDFWQFKDGALTKYSEQLPIQVSGVGHGVIVQHPDGNSLLLIERMHNGNQGRLWVFQGEFWELLPYTHDFYNPVRANEIFLITSIPRYGVLLAITANGASAPYQSILKID